jgi:hypothetical protein
MALAKLYLESLIFHVYRHVSWCFGLLILTPRSLLAFFHIAFLPQHRKRIWHQVNICKYLLQCIPIRRWHDPGRELRRFHMHLHVRDAKWASRNPWLPGRGRAEGLPHLQPYPKGPQTARRHSILPYPLLPPRPGATSHLSARRAREFE